MTRFTTGGRFSTHPVVLRVSPENTGTVELSIPLTLKAAKQLRLQLSDAIEWGVNMADLSKESNAGLNLSGDEPE
jgi:hypothetical protein